MKIINKYITRIEYKVRGLYQKRIAGRRKGPRIIANSIPKGGTHLLTRCLSLFPELTYTGTHYTRGQIEANELEFLLKKTGKGRFTAAHLWWSKENLLLLKQYSFKTILMLRDPRDIVVSGVFFILKRKDHHLHEYFFKLPDMDSRIKSYITGVDASKSSKGIKLANIKDSFGNYTPWISEKFNLLVLYEDLIGPKGGSRVDKQIEQVQRISNHLEQPLSPDEVIYVAQKTFSSKSVTFRKGVSGAWSDFFNKGHIKQFNDLAGQILIDFGYLLP